MSIAIRTDPVPLKMDEDGAIRVGGTRMTLDLIIAEHQAGASPEQIAAEYDTLSLPAYGRNRAVRIAREETGANLGRRDNGERRNPFPAKGEDDVNRFREMVQAAIPKYNIQRF
jgi:hypothetical protein